MKLIILEVIYVFVLMVIVGFGAYVFSVSECQDKVNQLRRKAVELGYGVWREDKETNQYLFVWKEK